MAEPWHQQTNEPDQAYIRFLFFLNLGPTRSLQKAYQAYIATDTTRSQARGLAGAVVQSGAITEVVPVDEQQKIAMVSSISGQWTNDCSKYQWLKRASEYDKANLLGMGRAIISNFYKAFDTFARKTAEAMEKAAFPSDDMESLRGNLTLLGGYIGADAVDSYLNAGAEEEDDAAAN